MRQELRQKRSRSSRGEKEAAIGDNLEEIGEKKTKKKEKYETKEGLKKRFLLYSNPSQSPLTFR
jgi:hypothetical protein